MSILEAIQEANLAATGVKHLAFAQLQEFNAFQDSFNFHDYPINVVVPFTVNGVIKNNRKEKIVVIRGWMLTRIKQDTNDFRSVKIEPDYIDPMRALAEKFMSKLLDTDIVDTSKEDVSYSITPEYAFLNTHLFGVSYSINLPILGKIC